MKSSIFRKQFLVFTGVLLISFFILALALTQAFRGFFVEQRKAMLVEQGEKISKVFKQAYYLGGIYNKDKLNSEITILDEYLDASFIFVSQDKKITMLSNDINSKWLGQTLDSEELDIALNGKIVEAQGNLGGIFDKPVLTVGYPVVVENNQMGVIFMNSPMTELSKTMLEAYRIILIASCVSILLGFILVYISSHRISKPLYEMNEAAKIIADGNFEKRINIKSNDEIGELAYNFNEMAESLYNQEVRRREFISNISHDLRSPLTSMRGFLQAILDGTIPKEKMDRYLQIVLDESERLSNLANNILDINKLEEPDSSLSFSTFDINELIEKTALSFEARVNEKKIKLNVTVCENQTFVNADYEKIQRVIYNLLDNAVKFTPENGRIDIMTEIKDKKVYISVKDNGKGVTEEERKRLFDRFYKADSSRGLDKKGSGLGLSIVKAFVKAHKSSITIESEIGKGCKFTFYLDIVKNKA